MNTIFCHSSEDMHELPDESVHLVVTSPPLFQRGQGTILNMTVTHDNLIVLRYGVFKECHESYK